MCRGQRAPGSKKPAPPVGVPVIVTFRPEVDTSMLSGAAVAGRAGGGARSLSTRIPHEFVALQYSWNVHIVMLSDGSTTTCEKSPHRCPSVASTLYAVELTTPSVAARVVPAASPASRPASATPAKSTE